MYVLFAPAAGFACFAVCVCVCVSALQLRPCPSASLRRRPRASWVFFFYPGRAKLSLPQFKPRLRHRCLGETLNVSPAPVSGFRGSTSAGSPALRSPEQPPRLEAGVCLLNPLISCSSLGRIGKSLPPSLPLSNPTNDQRLKKRNSKCPP